MIKVGLITRKERKVIFKKEGKIGGRKEMTYLAILGPLSLELRLYERINGQNFRTKKKVKVLTV